MTLEEQFAVAKEMIGSTTQDTQQQLKLYGLFKQAVVGDATGARPGITKLRERAKFDAWAANRGTSKEEAMRSYVSLVDSLALERLLIEVMPQTPGACSSVVWAQGLKSNAAIGQANHPVDQVNLEALQATCRRLCNASK